MKLNLSKQQKYIVVTIAVIAIIWYMNKSGMMSNMMGGAADLVYYYSPGCPHCVKFMPIWETISGVSKKKINCDSGNCEGIEALPTIKLNDKEYDGERTREAVEAFVASNL